MIRGLCGIAFFRGIFVVASLLNKYDMIYCQRYTPLLFLCAIDLVYSIAFSSRHSQSELYSHELHGIKLLENGIKNGRYPQTSSR